MVHVFELIFVFVLLSLYLMMQKKSVKPYLKHLFLSNIN